MKMKKFRVVNKFRFYSFISVMIILLSISVYHLFGSIKAYADSVIKDNYFEIVIEEGDTLWDIALKNKPEGMDVREMVYKIKKYNKMEEAYLYSGNTIKIPQ